MEQKTWWYSVNSDQKGPVTEDQLNLLGDQSFISPATPVWKEGLANWIPFSEINAPVDNSPKRPPLPGGSAQPAMNTAPPANGHAQQSNASSQGAPGFAQQPNRQQPNFNTQANANQSNFNGQDHAALPDRLNYISDLYYRVEFERIMNSNETYKGKFNWWALFFSWIWAFTKGLWQLGLLVMLVSTAANFLLPYAVSGVIGLGLAIFCGMRGTYFYYNLKMKNKQLF